MPRAVRQAGSLRALPQVHEILESRALEKAIARHGRTLVAGLLRECLRELRVSIRRKSLPPAEVKSRLNDLAGWVEGEADRRTASSIRPVINATGVVLHTNLGRALLSEASVRRMVEVARSYTTLEYDLERGRRGSRAIHLDRIFATLFPGRAVQVVNNNAAAVLLALNTLADGDRKSTRRIPRPSRTHPLRTQPPPCPLWVGWHDSFSWA